MSTTFYIDANRQNCSVKGDTTNNNEWTYKLANSLMLPPQTEIALQDTFINRKGITGQTIEIDEDIEEVVNYTYYLSDNPHFVPSTGFGNGFNPMDGGMRTMDNTFCPVGGMFQQNIDQTDLVNGDKMTERGQVIFFGENIPNQRLGMYRLQRGGVSSGQPFYNYMGMSPQFDPFHMGYSEMPMFACYAVNKQGGIDLKSQVHDTDIDSGDNYLCPLIGNTTIFIPKGVYSVNEISDLIEGQMSGKYTNIKNGDLYNDIINEKENLGTYDGSLGTDQKGIYRKANAFSFYGDAVNRTGVSGSDYVSLIGDMVNNNFINSPITNSAPYRTLSGTTGGKLYHSDHRDIISAPFSPNGNIPASAGTFSFNTMPNEDMIMYMPTHKFNQLVDFWKFTEAGCNLKREPESATTGYIDYYNSHQYFERAYRYGIQHWIGSGGGVNNKLYYQRQYSASDLDGSGNEKTFNVAGINNFNPQTEGVDNIGNASGVLPIGLHWKRKTFNRPMIQTAGVQYGFGGGLFASNGEDQTQDFRAMASILGLNYDIMSSGYYLGTPDFTFSYDADKSAFSMSNLHQDCRIPNLDMYGNDFSQSGSGCAFIKRVANRKLTEFTNQNGVDPNEYSRSKQQVIASYQTPQSRVGGIAVYNWGYKTALKYGDINLEFIRNGQQQYRNNTDADGLPDTLKNRTLWTFGDFFSTPQKAREAWDKTLWSKLGYTYENLQDENLWEKSKYYDIPNNSNDIDSQNVWTSLGHKENDFTCYGKTSKADLNIGSAPTISTANSAKFYRAGSYVEGEKKSVPDGSRTYLESTDYTSNRTYDNHDFNTPYNPFSGNPTIQATLGFNMTNFHVQDLYVNSFYRGITMTPIQTTGKAIVASKLPALSKDGYYVITSDIVDNWSDDLKQGQPLPLLGIVPISNLSNQDFLTNKNTLIHTISQPKVINAVKIKILKPDLTAPQLEPNSSVLLQITMPLPPTNPQQPNINKDDDKKEDNTKHPEEDPRA
tara:strand:- start:8017 stop:11004 length:2988 start_codon:yes stop_codon:yes gene_type:complete